MVPTALPSSRYPVPGDRDTAPRTWGRARGGGAARRAVPSRSEPCRPGMASRERLYELWMLYFAKVRPNPRRIFIPGGVQHLFTPITPSACVACSPGGCERCLHPPACTSCLGRIAPPFWGGRHIPLRAPLPHPGFRDPPAPCANRVPPCPPEISPGSTAAPPGVTAARGPRSPRGQPRPSVTPSPHPAVRDSPVPRVLGGTASPRSPPSASRTRLLTFRGGPHPLIPIREGLGGFVGPPCRRVPAPPPGSRCSRGDIGALGATWGRGQGGRPAYGGVSCSGEPPHPTPRVPRISFSP